MARPRIMQRFAKWHIWLGWLVGFPILMWTVTGLVMVSRPIEDVRGDHLRTETALFETQDLTFPADRIGTVSAVSLVQQVDGPVWIVTEADGARFRYSASDGSLVPPMIDSEARRIAQAAYAGDAALESVTYFPEDISPADLRAPFPAWQARFADGTHVYMRAATGEVVAVRTSWWRVFDFMWGLHIMDLETREDTSHPVLILFAALSVIGSLFGCALLFRRRKARAKGPA